MWITCWHCDVLTRESGKPANSRAISVRPTHPPNLGAVSCPLGRKSRMPHVRAATLTADDRNSTVGSVYWSPNQCPLPMFAVGPLTVCSTAFPRRLHLPPSFPPNENPDETIGTSVPRSTPPDAPMYSYCGCHLLHGSEHMGRLWQIH